MKFDSNLPIYIQIMDHVKGLILSGQIKEGEQIPSIRDLSASLKVNPNTIQRAYQELEREDLIESRRGMGNYVTDKEEIIKRLKVDRAESLSVKYINDMRALGMTEEEILERSKDQLKEGK